VGNGRMWGGHFSQQGGRNLNDFDKGGRCGEWEGVGNRWAGDWECFLLG
jgi:hypothetical protein